MIQQPHELLFSRNSGILSPAEQTLLQNSCVAIAGVGGVGGIQLITLARAGVGAFHIADPEVFGLSDSNRQYGAMQSTQGKNKAQVMADLVKDINPDCQIKIYAEGINAKNIADFVHNADAVIDAVEYFTLSEKVRLYQTARAKEKFVFTAPIVGFGCVMHVYDPQGVSFEEYYELTPETTVLSAAKTCPQMPAYVDPELYAQALRRERPIPSMATAANLSGSMLATEVLMYLLQKRPVRCIPQSTLIDLYRLDVQQLNPKNEEALQNKIL